MGLLFLFIYYLFFLLLLAPAPGLGLIGFHNTGHQFMAHDILARQFHKAYAGYVFEYAECLNEPRAL